MIYLFSTNSERIIFDTSKASKEYLQELESRLDFDPAFMKTLHDESLEPVEKLEKLLSTALQSSDYDPPLLTGLRISQWFCEWPKQAIGLNKLPFTRTDL